MTWWHSNAAIKYQPTEIIWIDFLIAVKLSSLHHSKESCVYYIALLLLTLVKIHITLHVYRHAVIRLDGLACIAHGYSIWGETIVREAAAVCSTFNTSLCRWYKSSTTRQPLHVIISTTHTEFSTFLGILLWTYSFKASYLTTSIAHYNDCPK